MKYIIYGMLIATFAMNVQASEKKENVDLTPPQFAPTFYNPHTPQEQCAVLVEKRKEFVEKNDFKMVRLMDRMIKERQQGN